MSKLSKKQAKAISDHINSMLVWSASINNALASNQDCSKTASIRERMNWYNEAAEALDAMGIVTTRYGVNNLPE